MASGVQQKLGLLLKWWCRRWNVWNGGMSKGCFWNGGVFKGYVQFVRGMVVCCGEGMRGV